ncbi:hypothetical protein PEC301877_36330 [Pectobacterium carotovorum subsp. carotovorum]|nr:hypothetical protein PEC301877_36330 [Pectobacterium carotovorum subsp. carotovorum]
MRSSSTVFLVAFRTRPTKGGSIAVALGTLAFGGKLCRYAVPSGKASSLRTADDAFPTRHRLARHPCRLSESMLFPQHHLRQGGSTLRVKRTKPP